MDDFENQDEFRGLVALARTTAQVRPPRDLTSRIMAAVAAEPVGLLHKIRQFLLKPHQADQELKRLLSSASRGPDISICFFAAAFFHLVLSLVLRLGLDRFQGRFELSSWIMAQPNLALIMAIFLLAIGFALLAGRPVVLRAARVLVLIYVFVSIINAFSLQLAVPSPLTLAGALLFAGWGATLGAFLYAAIRARLVQVNQTGPAGHDRLAPN